MKSRIYMVIHSFYPLIGGAETYAQGLAERLVKRGHRVVVLTIRHPGMKGREFIKGIEVRRLPAPNIPGLRFALYFTRLFLYILKRRKEIDIIHSYQTFTAGFMAAIIGKILRKPAILREGAESITLLKDSKNPIKCLLMKYAVKNTHEIYPTNPKAVPVFLDLGARKRQLEILWTPLDTRVFRPSKTRKRLRKKMGLEGKFVLLFVGRLVGFKNVKCLINTLPFLKDIENLKVLVAGYGPEEENLKTQARGLGVSDQVKFLGKVPFRDIGKYYQVSDVLVHPALSALPEWSFPSNTVFQAMSSSLPVVSTADHQFSRGKVPLVKTIRDMEAGIAVRPNSPEYLARAIIRLYKSPKLRAKLGKAGRRIVLRELGWDRHIKKITDKYRELQHLSRTKK